MIDEPITHIVRRDTGTSRSFCGAVSYRRFGWMVSLAGAKNPDVWQSIGTTPRNALCVVCCQRAVRAPMRVDGAAVFAASPAGAAVR